MTHLYTYLQKTEPHKRQFVEVRLGQYATNGFSEAKLLTREQGLFLSGTSTGDKLYNNCQLVLDLEQAVISKKAKKKLRGKQIIALSSLSKCGVVLSVIITKQTFSYRVLTCWEVKKLTRSAPHLGGSNGQHIVWARYVNGKTDAIGVIVGLKIDKMKRIDFRAAFKEKQPSMAKRCYQKISKLGALIKQLWRGGL